MASVPRERSRPGQNQNQNQNQNSSSSTHTMQAPTLESSDMAAPRSLNDPQTEDNPTCWICQQDKSDDPPEKEVPWRKPCPCSLVAHEECLLEWIADQEKPKAGAMAAAQKIKCPQCQAEIRIDRPRDLIVGFYDKAASASRAALLPVTISAIGGCVYSGLLMYGINAFMLVFGPEEAMTMLDLTDRPPSRRLSLPILLKDLYQGLKYTLMGSDPFFPGFMIAPWKVLLGLPAIAPALVLLRTRTSEYAFPLFLSIYVARTSWKTPHIWSWPPSPALTFATIPYLRTAYTELYKHTFSDLEKKWDKAVRRPPREGETAEDIAGEAEEGNGLFELEIIDQEVDENGVPVPQRLPVMQPQAPAPIEGQLDGELREGQVNPAELAPAADAPEHNHENWNIRRDFDIIQVANTVMGALAFPFISACMGDVLNLVLPDKMVGRGHYMRYGPKGILKERWGRTVVGGCLFVVLKDAVTLYCKWKKARDFGRRKVIDYVKPNGKR